MTTAAVTTAADENDEHDVLRHEIRRLCARFPGAYWRALDRERGYPSEFVAALAEAGWLGALIPTEYGGAGLTIAAAGAILEEIHATGASAAAVHAQMYIMRALLRHGSTAQQARWLPDIAAGRVRLQAFGVTEPNSGSDTTAIETTARRTDDGWVIDGQKVFTSRAEHSDLMLVLARTTPAAECARRTEGLSLFLVDLRAHRDDVVIRPIETMVNHATTQVFLRDVRIGVEALVGREGDGFRHLLDSLNAERVLIAHECVGDARFCIDRATAYARERVVFGRPIGANQGVQFPIARAWLHLHGARLACQHAAALLDADEAAAATTAGAAANAAKFLCAEASWEAANVAMDTLGGYGMAVEYDVERKFRETRLYQVAPVTSNMILAYVAQQVLGLARAY